MRTPPILLAASLLFSPSMLAQAGKPAAPPSSPPATYKLTFVVSQLIKGKQEGRRSYSVLFTPSRVHGSLRAGNRIPTPNLPNPAGGTRDTTRDYEFRSSDVNIDFHTPEELADKYPDNELPLYLNAEVISSDPSPTPGLNAPLIRTDRWESNSVLSLNRPTMLFSSDDPAVDETTQVELTVTRSK